MELLQLAQQIDHERRMGEFNDEELISLASKEGLSNTVFFNTQGRVTFEDVNGETATGIQFNHLDVVSGLFPAELLTDQSDRGIGLTSSTAGDERRGRPAR